VDLDVERSAFAENALRYETDVAQMLGDIKDLLAVVRG
jgi:flagellar basal body rod protein FlgB